MCDLINYRFFLYLLIAVTQFENLSAQEIKQLTNPWPVETENYFQGFDKPLSGTELDYFPFLEKGNIVLYLGEDGLYSSHSFQTEPIPANYNQAFITYVWQAAIGKSSSKELSEFKMSINNQDFLSFTTFKEGLFKSWEYSDKKGKSLSFIHTKTGKATGELFGYMILKLPTNEFSNGEPITIKFDEIKSYGKDFFMVIQNPAKESIELIEEAAILKTPQGPKQSVRVELTHLGKPTTVHFSYNGESIKEVVIKPGKNEIYLNFDPVDKLEKGLVTIDIDGGQKINREIILKTVGHFEVYFLPHSHVDIGFTHKQDEVAKLQWKNLDLALDLVNETSDFPEGSKFKWNAEISWVLDGYLKQVNDERKKMFIEAVKNGSIGVDALYGSVLTGLQREEELFHNTSFSNTLIEEYGFDIQSAMISDVPGYTWGIVPGLKKTGIKYFSVGPNHMPQLAHGGWQVGHTLEAWGDIPFYWVSPSGKDKVLFWMSTHGYSWFHSWSTGNISHAGSIPILNFLNDLEDQKYPYNMVQLRYNIGNDNGPPDPDMPEFFKQWNEKYEWPKLIISTTMEMMEEFENRYGDKIPEASGDFTPYWEDGAASSATETAINRNTADRLVQAETLWAMTGKDDYPVDKMDEAWTNVVLFSEHTWGALQSKSDPDSEITKSLWDVKKSFALDAQKSAEESIVQATASITSISDKTEAIQVFNTLSWSRSNLVRIPQDLLGIGHRLIDDNGKEIASQLLSTGELAFVATNIPAFGSRIYRFKKGKTIPNGHVIVAENKISNDKISVEINSTTGLIQTVNYNNHQFVNEKDTLGFNAYWYSGLIKENLTRNHSPKFTIKENGPLLSSILIETEGKGSNGISQEIEMVSGINKINIVNVVDKLRVTENENVRFSFPFDVPEGKVRIDIPWAVLEPGINQLAGANKNFYSAQRFLDISNDKYGVTLTTADAPIWEIGEMSGQYWMEDMKARPWLKEYMPSQTLFTWAMNNAWFVNYKAFQEGKIRYRYNLIPHGKYSHAQAKKAGMEQTMPLIIIPVSKKSKSMSSKLMITGSKEVLVTSLKPSTDGKAWVVRYFNCSDQENSIQTNWSMNVGLSYLSSPLEEKGSTIDNSFILAPWEILTIRTSKE